MIANNQPRLLDKLSSMLEKQIELARLGNISQVEVLSKQASSLVEKITRSGTLEWAEVKDRRKRLQKLYEDLRLALVGHKASVCRELNMTRKSRKTMKAYRENV